ncbi:hypothetical protein Nmel_003058, partial [Mimus melanotis]
GAGRERPGRGCGGRASGRAGPGQARPGPTMAAEGKVMGQSQEQFLLLAKAARGAALASLIHQVLEAPGIYVFGELLDMPAVRELADSEFSPVFRLLTIFAYGTYADYLGETGRGAGVPSPPARWWGSCGAGNAPETLGAEGLPPRTDPPTARAEPPARHTPDCALGPRRAGYLAVINAAICRLPKSVLTKA